MMSIDASSRMAEPLLRLTWVSMSSPNREIVTIRVGLPEIFPTLLSCGKYSAPTASTRRFQLSK